MIKKHKILFLNPPDISLLNDSDIGYSYFEPPLGLLYVYSYIKNRQDCECLLEDLNIKFKLNRTTNLKYILVETLQTFQPDIVAMSTMYYSGIPVFNEIIDTIKQFNNNILTVLGGHYPTHLPEKCMSNLNLDYAVISEGELGFSELIDYIKGERQLDDIQGILYRENEKLIKKERKTFWSGFSESKILPWRDLQFQHYFKDSRNVLFRVKNKDDIKIAAITASRGCPNQCSFCSSPNFWKRRWRKRNVNNVIDEIKFLINEYGVNTVIFNDENISVHKSWFLELLREIKKLNITWISGGGLSIRTINSKEVIEAMVESGIGLFNIAIESCDNNNLKRIKKTLTIEETENVIDLIRRTGDSFIIGFFIVGFPWDTLDDVNFNLDYAGKLDLDWKSFYCFQPFPGCELYNYCIDSGIMSDFNTNYGENYFAGNFKHKGFSNDELNKLVYSKNLKYNFLENRNLKLNTGLSLAQAERDFKYVDEIVPDHVFARLGLAEIMAKKGDLEEKNNLISSIKNIMIHNSADWDYYLKQFRININEL